MLTNCRRLIGLLLPLMLGGCGLSGAGGTKKAAFILPRERRILVFVDVHPTVTAPAGFAAKLGDAISTNLYKYKAVDHLAGQVRLAQLRRDPDKFQKMGIEDVARATDSDLVVYVDLITFNVSSISDNSLTQGLAQVLVKVVDRNGKRLWPVDNVMGERVDEKIDPAFTEEQSKAAVQDKLNADLAEDVGRLFHDYVPTSREMIK